MKAEINSSYNIHHIDLILPDDEYYKPILKSVIVVLLSLYTDDRLPNMNKLT